MSKARNEALLHHRACSTRQLVESLAKAASQARWPLTFSCWFTRNRGWGLCKSIHSKSVPSGCLGTTKNDRSKIEVFQDNSILSTSRTHPPTFWLNHHFSAFLRFSHFFASGLALQSSLLLSASSLDIEALGRLFGVRDQSWKSRSLCSCWRTFATFGALNNCHMKEGFFLPKFFQSIMKDFRIRTYMKKTYP